VNGKQLTGTAEWSNILKPFEVDRCNVYRLLPKVTECAQNVKVSLIAQIISGAVGPHVNTVVRIGKDNSTVSLNDTGLSAVVLHGAAVRVDCFLL
jgi:hypothetical protein